MLPKKGLLATIDGQLYRSPSDAGSWTALPAAGAQLDRLEAAGAKEYWVVPRPSEWEQAIVLRTTDGGKTFRPAVPRGAAVTRSMRSRSTVREPRSRP